MKKLLIISAIITVFFIAGCTSQKAETGYAPFGRVDITSTSTSATNNIKLLDANQNRKYAAVINDSDTVVYLYPDNFTDTAAASTTLMANKGVRLNANGGSFEITSDNLYTGQLWLATTTAGKNVLVIEK